MPVNRERLIEVAAWAAGEDAKRRLGLPSEWHQGTYLGRQHGGCGTTCCIAGKIALDDGCTPIWSSFGDASFVKTSDGGTIYVGDYARNALGLAQFQANSLFLYAKDLDEVLRAVGEILDEDEE